jgi:glycosyltransferase involved in cell wall biosynthesis
MLIGNGELFSYLVRKAEKIGIISSVLFIGVTDRASDYMNAMDVFALPSLFEGLPLVAVEAQAAGLPVFLSDNVSHEAQIAENVLFLPLIKSVWTDKILSAKERNRVSVGETVKESRFNIENQVKKLTNYYGELIKNGI